MTAVFRYEHAVRPDEIDPPGHVNNLAYLRWMQTAALGHSAAVGWPWERYLELGGVWVARSHYIEYRQPAFRDEQLVIETWIADFGKITSRREYRVLRPADGTLLAVARTQWAFVSLATHAPRRIPADVSSAFTVVPDEPAR